MSSILVPDVRVSYLPTDEAPTHMIISPYTDEPHLLDLRTVDVQEQLLAHALVRLQSSRDDYATANYVESFNWNEVAQDLRSRVAAIGHHCTAQTFYIVVFRLVLLVLLAATTSGAKSNKNSSQILPTTNYSHLGALDKAAHAEAGQSGGFLK